MKSCELQRREVAMHIARSCVGSVTYTARFRIQGHHRRAIGAGLTKTGRKLLRSHRLARVTATITVKSGKHRSQTSRATLRVRRK